MVLSCDFFQHGSVPGPELGPGLDGGRGSCLHRAWCSGQVRWARTRPCSPQGHSLQEGPWGSAPKQDSESHRLFAFSLILELFLKSLVPNTAKHLLCGWQGLSLPHRWTRTEVRPSPLVNLVEFDGTNFPSPSQSARHSPGAR